MTRTFKWMLALGLVLLPIGLRAGDMSKMPAMKGSPEFEKLKSLAGTWTGKAKMHSDKAQSIKIVYEVTAGGTAVLERLFPGTDHEMVSVYNQQGGKLYMTHYCTMGNAPKMSLQKATADSLSFELKGKEGLSSDKEMHMHSMSITWKDANHITEDWISYQDGKPGHSSPFALTRKKK